VFKRQINANVTDIVRDITYNEKENRDELKITFILQEGEQYTYGGTEFVGNKVFSKDELEDLIKLKKGDIFNQTLFQQGLSAIADKYYEEGYTSNSFEPQTKRDNIKYVVSSTFTIKEQAQSHIDNIIIKGNSKTKDYVIRREIPLESGDVFSKTKVQTGLRSLYNLQYFSAIVPDVVPGSEENSVDLIINVEEQSTTSIEFGVTFSGVDDDSDWPISLFAKWQDSNVGGTGQTISTSVTGSYDTQSLSLGYNNSWFLDKTIDFSSSLSLSHSSETDQQVMYLPSGVNTDDYYFDYTEYSVGGDVSLGKRWVKEAGTILFTGGLSTDLTNDVYDDDLYEPVDTDISDNLNNWGWQNSIWTKLSFDDRDINYDPSKGYFGSQKVSWIGLIPAIEDEFYLRTDTKVEKYFTLLDYPVSSSWNLKFVLAGYSGLSLLFPTANTDISSDNQVYIDGMFTGRGWDIDDDTGDAMWSNYVELRMPIATGIFALDFFGDAAVVKDSPVDLFTDLGLEDWRFSFGPGLRFSMPQFPLRLLLANSFRYDESDGWVWDDDNSGSDDGPQWNFVLSFNITNK
jgi:outer membrane protein insertion porin family